MLLSIRVLDVWALGPQIIFVVYIYGDVRVVILETVASNSDEVR